MAEEDGRRLVVQGKGKNVVRGCEGTEGRTRLQRDEQGHRASKKPARSNRPDVDA